MGMNHILTDCDDAAVGGKRNKNDENIFSFFPDEQQKREEKEKPIVMHLGHWEAAIRF